MFMYVHCVIYMYAVSYTHLDVYKRQVCVCVEYPENSFFNYWYFKNKYVYTTELDIEFMFHSLSLPFFILPMFV